jgi:multidrug transporter EmrE-like cation transporter
VTKKSLLPFAATSVIWGSSFLFIRLAVEHMPPATVVFGRTLLGAAFLVPLAVSRRAFRGIRPVIVPVVVVTVLDMAAPTFLGVALLGEPLTIGAAAGLVLIMSGPLPGVASRLRVKTPLMRGITSLNHQDRMRDRAPSTGAVKAVAPDAGTRGRPRSGRIIVFRTAGLSA